jgi:site-specific DNA-methyltransferase (adenine-specific)
MSIEQKIFESTNDKLPTTPAITYSECYAQVFLGDCLELYKNIESKSIDLILTDLPYGTTACKWDTIIPFDKLWEMVNYLLKPNGVFITTASQPFTSALVMSNPKMFKYEWIWEKHKGTNIYGVKREPLKIHENCLIFSNGKFIYNPQMTNGEPYKKRGSHNVGKSDGLIIANKSVGYAKDFDSSKRYPKSIQFFANHNQKENSLHPTQKPIALFEYLLKTYSNENMTIFDPCMGSGTTGIACKNLNRNFIGIEKDENYFKIAEQRINARTLFS